MLSVKKTGDWARLQKVTQNLSKGNFIAKYKVTLDKDAEMIKEKIIGHISAQDLGWTPLSEETVRIKGSTKAYIETGTLKSGLQVKKMSLGNGYSVYISPAPKATTHSGKSLKEILMYLEYGTQDIPARPLIRPTWEEVKPLIKNDMKKALAEILKG